MLVSCHNDFPLNKYTRIQLIVSTLHKNNCACMCVPVRALPLRCTFIFLPVNKQEQTRVNQIGHSHGEFQARLEGTP